MKTFNIELTIDELLTLDGKVSEEAQKVIDAAKQEWSFGFDDMPIINEILKKSLESGKFTWTYKDISSCKYCDKKHQYAIRKRSTRYHSKGSTDYSKPMYYSGIDFNTGFITFKGLGDMCSECCNKYKIVERVTEYIIKHDLKIEIQNYITRYLKDDVRVCHRCNEEMQESKMGRNTTLMGDGTYPSKCPHCGAEAVLFGPNHKSTNKFVMIHNPHLKAEIIELENELNKQDETSEHKHGLYLKQGNYNGHKNYFYIQGTRSEVFMTVNVNTKRFMIGDNFNIDLYGSLCPILIKHGYTVTKDKWMLNSVFTNNVMPTVPKSKDANKGEI